MENELKKVREAVGFLRARGDIRPEMGILTGTGLGNCAESVAVETAFDYQEIPHFPVSTVVSHPGRLLTGRLHGKKAVVMQGRVHLYEGYSPRQVIFPIRIMQALGVKALIITNASGGMQPRLRPGHIMVIRDHINLTGANPLTGPHSDAWGERFVDMHRAYDSGLAALAHEIAGQKRLSLVDGIYAGLRGPSLETPAEVRFLQTVGADAVGFSTVMEVIAAVQAGMRILGLSVITNVHSPDHPAPAMVEDILAVANQAAVGLDRLINQVVARL